MTEQAGPSAEVKAKPKPKRPIEVLRDRQGGLSKDLKEFFNEQQRIFKAIRAALAAGPRTVPQLAAECGFDPPKAMWHVMALRRDGEVVDDAERDGYVLYRLKGAQP
jgi:hypothetical protein